MTQKPREMTETMKVLMRKSRISSYNPEFVLKPTSILVHNHNVINGLTMKLEKYVLPRLFHLETNSWRRSDKQQPVTFMLLFLRSR
jgi:hypothetical protein